MASCFRSAAADRRRSRRTIPRPALGGRAFRTRSAVGIKPGRPIRPRAFARRARSGSAPWHAARFAGVAKNLSRVFNSEFRAEVQTLQIGFHVRVGLVEQFLLAFGSEFVSLAKKFSNFS